MTDVTREHQFSNAKKNEQYAFRSFLVQLVHAQEFEDLLLVACPHEPLSCLRRAPIIHTCSRSVSAEIQSPYMHHKHVQYGIIVARTSDFHTAAALHVITMIHSTKEGNQRHSLILASAAFTE